ATTHLFDSTIMFQRSHHSGGSWFSRRRGNKANRKLLGHRTGYRVANCELLEDRKMLTTTLYVDFGAGVGGGKMVVGADQLSGTLVGRDLGLGSEPIQFESLRSYIGRTQFDFDKKGSKGDTADYTALRNSVMDIVKRQYAPFDVVVKEGKAN